MKVVCSAAITIINMNDITSSPTAPLNPTEDFLWMDTSMTPPLLKIWKGDKWVNSADEVVGTTNLLKNTGLRKDTKNWSLPSGITRDTTQKKGSRNSFKYQITGLTTDGWRAADPERVAVDEYKRYSTACEIYIPSNHRIDKGLALEVQWFNAAGVRVKTDTVSPDLTLKDRWQRIKIERLRVPSGAVTANARVWVRQNGTFYVAELILTDGAKIGSWVAHPDDIKNEIDDTVDEAIKGQTQEEIFNKLTNNGKSQGIFLDDEKNYYFEGKYFRGENLNIVRHSDRKSTLKVDSVGEVEINAKKLSIGGTTVATTTNVNDAINNIEIGARNLLPQTSDEFKTVNMSDWNYPLGDFTLASLGLKVGDNVAFRLYLKFGNTFCGGSARFTFYNANGDNMSTQTGRNIPKNSEGFSQVLTTIPKEAVRVWVGVQKETAGAATPNVALQYHSPKFETGTICTGWTSALEDMENAYTILLSNEVQVFPTNVNRVPMIGKAYSTDVVVYKGTAQRTDFTIGKVNSANGITVTQTASRVTFSVGTATTLGADDGLFTIPITIDGKTFNKVFSWACGKQGTQGVQGYTGATGKGVSSITEEYYLSTSKINQTGGSWVTTPPTWSVNTYLWTRSKIVYNNPNSTTYTTPIVDSSWEAVNNIVISGINLILKSKNILLNSSDNGNINCSIVENDYVKISPTNNGNAYNAEIKSSKARLQGEVYTLSFEVLTPTKIGFYWYPSESYNRSSYIDASNKWQKVVFTYTQTNEDKATPFLFGLRDLVKGQVYKYRNLQLERGNKPTDWTEAPEDVQERINNTVANVDVMYYLSTSSTSLVGGKWTTLAPQWENGKFMWQKVVTTLKNGKALDSDPTCIAGAQGSTGKGVKSIIEQYYHSTSMTSLIGGSWGTAAPTPTSGKYIWTRSVIAYTDNTNTTTTAICTTGATGNTGATGPTGATGTSIKSVDVEYYLSTSNSSLSGGNWVTNAPAWVNGKFMWSRTKTTYSAGNPSYSNPACITGQQGSTGNVGTGVTSITEEYYLSTSKATQTGGSWVTIPPTWRTGTYLWTRSKIVYNNPTSTVYTPAICDSSWEAVNEIELGLRNILLNSSFQENTDKWHSSGDTQFTTIDGKKCTNIRHTTLNSTKYIFQSLMGKLEPNTKYTMSGWVRTDNIVKGTTNFTIMFYHDGMYNNNGVSTWYGYGSKVFTINTGKGEWEYLTWTFTTDAKLQSATASSMYVYTRDFTGDVYFYNLKLEKGNKPTGWTEAPEDIQEEINNAVASVDVMYYLSTSSSSLAGGSWVTKAPNWVNGKYMWSKTVTVLKSGSSTESDPTCIAGAQGATGSSGKGVISVAEQYYHSTSMTTMTGGSWSPAAPTPTSGKYIWTRSVVTYTDKTSTTTTAICTTGATGSKGDAGADAKTVDIVASSQVFKSTDGGKTFSPNTITLTPTLQNVAYSNWQYSVNGGSNWATVTNGQNGLTISGNVLTIRKDSPLFTSSVTSLVFRVNTNVNNIYDTMTVIKLYDVTELSQLDVFNKLTNNGQNQGIFMEKNKLWLNMEYAKAKTITADKLAIGDFTNYAQLNDDTAPNYGFTVGVSEVNGAWLTKVGMARDILISESYPCNGGESFRLKGDVSTTIKGSTTYGGTNSEFLGTSISVFAYDGTGKLIDYLNGKRLTNQTLSVSDTITLPSNARSFKVYIQTEGWGNWSGALKVRNIQITKMANAELVVNGSITTEKLHADVLSANRIVSIVNGGSTTINGGMLTTNSITADRLHTDVLSANKIVSIINGGSTTIDGGILATSSIAADKIAVGDFTNYALLSDSTASNYGFTVGTSEAGGTWLTRTSAMTRDIFISDYYPCNGGESFRIKFDISTTIMGNAANGGTDSSYRGTAIGLYCYDGTGKGVGIYYSQRHTNTTVTGSSSIVTIPSTVRKFKVFIQTDSYGNWSGILKIRNIQVFKMSNSELIVNGSISADKLAVNAVTADMITSGTFKGLNFIAGGSGNTGGIELLGEDDTTLFKANKRGGVYAKNINFALTPDYSYKTDGRYWADGYGFHGLAKREDHGSLNEWSKSVDITNDNIAMISRGAYMQDTGELYLEPNAISMKNYPDLVKDTNTTMLTANGVKLTGRDAKNVEASLELGAWNNSAFRIKVGGSGTLSNKFAIQGNSDVNMAVFTPTSFTVGAADANEKIIVLNTKNPSMTGRAGMYINTTNFGLYDWQNNRHILQYHQPSGIVRLMGHPAMIGVSTNGYYGLCVGDNVSDWIRSSLAGLIPYASGGNSSSLGAPGWSWKEIHGQGISCYSALRYDGGHGTNYLLIGGGIGDGINYGANNMRTQCHWGWGISDYAGNTNAVIDARLGRFIGKSAYWHNSSKSLKSDVRAVTSEKEPMVLDLKSYDTIDQTVTLEMIDDFLDTINVKTYISDYKQEGVTQEEHDDSKAHITQLGYIADEFEAHPLYKYIGEMIGDYHAINTTALISTLIAGRQIEKRKRLVLEQQVLEAQTELESVKAELTATQAKLDKLLKHLGLSEEII